MTRGKLIIGALIGVFIILVAYPAIKKSMFVLPPNTLLWISVGLIAATIGFIIYGAIKGFKNTFPSD